MKRLLVVLLAAIALPLPAQTSRLIDPKAEADSSWRIEAALSIHRADTYVDRYYNRQRFPSALTLEEFAVAVSKGLSDRWRVGVEVPFENASFSGPEGAVRLRGTSVFLQAGTRTSIVDLFSRASYFHPADRDDPLFIYSKSPEISLVGAVATADGILPGSTRAVVNLSVRYAPEHQLTKAFGAARLQAAWSLREFRAGRFLMQAAPTAGFELRSSGQFAGIHFANRASSGAFGGAVVDLRRSHSPAESLSITVTRDFTVLNSLEGWGVSLSARKTF